MKKPPIIIKTVLLAGVLVINILSISQSQDKDSKKVTFLPSWIPQPQFAGYYMAKEKGIYAKKGLDVTINQGGYTQDVIASLKNGTIDFGILFLYTGVLERAKGTKLVNIGQIFQQNSILFVALKSSGIKTINDFNGKRIGIWRTIATELTTGFLEKQNIHAKIIPFNNGNNVFLKGAVDIIVMMYYNEYKRLINSGINPDEINTFYFKDYEMNFPEDGIYCMENTFKRDPKMCKKFVEATLEGWRYALKNIDETITVIDTYKKKARISYNRSHSLWMLNAMNDQIHPSNKNVPEGYLLEKDFEYLTNLLYEHKYINDKPLYNDFFKGSK